mgnify:CR=1 FL=1
MNLANITQAEKMEIDYPIAFVTLREKIIYLLHREGPLRRKQVQVDGYPLVSEGRVDDHKGYLTLSITGLELLIEITDKDLTEPISMTKILSAFGREPMNVSDVLNVLKTEATPSNMNTVRTRLNSAFRNNKLVMCGTNTDRSIMYTPGSSGVVKKARINVGKQLAALQAVRDERIAMGVLFQTALPGTLSASSKPKPWDRRI